MVEAGGVARVSSLHRHLEEVVELLHPHKSKRARLSYVGDARRLQALLGVRAAQDDRAGVPRVVVQVPVFVVPHDVQVRSSLGAGDEPGGDRRARKLLGDQAPE